MQKEPSREIPWRWEEGGGAGDWVTKASWSVQGAYGSSPRPVNLDAQKEWTGLA